MRAGCFLLELHEEVIAGVIVDEDVINMRISQDVLYVLAFPDLKSCSSCFRVWTRWVTEEQ